MVDGRAAGGGDVVGVLEVGGSHVTTAVVRGHDPEAVQRRSLHAGAPANEIVGAFAGAIAGAAVPWDAPWVVAVPGPFDYARGVGRYTGVGKFDALNGVDLGARLRAELAPRPLELYFVNDAAAFAIGEWYAGLGEQADRCVGLTLGSGIGSTFLDRGHPVTTGVAVPPDGELHLTRLGGVAPEELVSRRALLRAYGSRVDAPPDLDVAGVFARARVGDRWAVTVIERAITHLGRVLDPWLASFHAQVVVVGGGMAGSWDLIEPALTATLTVDIPVRRSTDPVRSALVGAAVCLPRHRRLQLR